MENIKINEDNEFKIGPNTLLEFVANFVKLPEEIDENDLEANMISCQEIRKISFIKFFQVSNYYILKVSLV